MSTGMEMMMRTMLKAFGVDAGPVKEAIDRLPDLLRFGYEMLNSIQAQANRIEQATARIEYAISDLAQSRAGVANLPMLADFERSEFYKGGQGIGEFGEGISNGG